MAPGSYPPGLTNQEKRQYMAKVFEATQREMSDTNDLIFLTKRSAVPFPSTWQGESIAYSGPVPTDEHLIPSGLISFKGELPEFEPDTDVPPALNLGGKPYAAYKKMNDSIFIPKPQTPTAVAPRKTRTAAQDDLWRAQYAEWQLQKNAFNPDIAAGLRTNVKKQASLTVPPLDKAADPARSSENVKAALTHSEEPASRLVRSRSKIDPSVYFPAAMS
jgi:hypothetical protein